MPGSLGVEAIIELMQTYAIDQDLGAGFNNPKFGQILSDIKWKYRGQINPLNKQMSLDVHITSVTDDNGKRIIMGDANLSKDGLRIYEVKDIAICIEEA
jgi:3-hydroxymyristoyl/3-hydroxydecanoyl-(acyl carrier protein) dehydratase